jgi:hypothetical protein
MVIKAWPTVVLTRGRRLGLAGAGVALLLSFSVGAAVARNSMRTHRGQPAKHSAVKVGLRAATFTSAGGTVSVSATASGPGADTTRALWYETVEGAAQADQAGATRLERRVIDSSGRVLAHETDPVDPSNPAANAPLTLSQDDIARVAQEHADDLGARVVETRYLPLFGGTAELVVQPADPMSFAQSAGTLGAKLISPLALDHRPYLLTIVDATEKPLLVLGFTPGVGGGTGQGIAWQAPGIKSSAVWGGLSLRGSS